jgi:carboxymethylenebutenolidase
MIEFPGRPNPARPDAPTPGTGSGYLAAPSGGRGHGLLVLHSWWGLNDAFRQMCDGLAAEGFVALAPDAYGTGDAARTIEEATQRSEQMDLVRAEQILLGAADRLAQEVEGPSGTVGFSMGAGFGLWLARKRPEALAGTVLFYGVGEPGDGGTPVLGHFAGDDEWEGAEDVEALGSALREAGRLEEFHVYEGARHWFAEPDRPEFDAAASELAWQRTLEFLRRVLPA